MGQHWQADCRKMGSLVGIGAVRAKVESQVSRVGAVVTQAQLLPPYKKVTEPPRTTKSTFPVIVTFISDPTDHKHISRRCNIRIRIPEAIH
jgi:hypothetical protein